MLVNVVSVEASTLEPPPFYGSNEAELRAVIEDPAFDYGTLSATVDGVAVPHLERYLVESPLYTFSVPDNNVLGVPADTGQSVAKACMFMLAPLPVGKHVIQVHGEFPNADWVEGVTFNITVVPGRK